MSALAAAIIVGAGSGERLGAGVPKAFADLAGEPLLVHAVRACAQAQSIHATVVVVASDDVERASLLLEESGHHALVCAGGPTRMQSVALGMRSCPEGTDVVAVHDAARPLVSPALIDRTVAALQDPWSAAAPALPVVDTLKLVEGERVVRTVDREGLLAVQTPQVFGIETLQRAHASGEASATDDLVLVEQAGGTVRLIAGERTNFKITYPEDLTMAAALVAARAASGEQR